jgi:hypothetical protein
LISAGAGAGMLERKRTARTAQMPIDAIRSFMLASLVAPNLHEQISIIGMRRFPGVYTNIVSESRQL